MSKSISIKPARVFVDTNIRTRSHEPLASDIEARAVSIKQHGQITPIAVRKFDGKGDFDYTLIDGENRLKACELNEMNVEACVFDVDEGEAVAMAFAANDERTELTALDRFQSVMLFKKKLALNNKEIAARMNLDAGEITRILKLEKLSDTIRAYLKVMPGSTTTDAEGNETENAYLSMSQAIALLDVPVSVKKKDGKEVVIREGVAKRAAENRWTAAKIAAVARKIQAKATETAVEKPEPKDKNAGKGKGSKGGRPSADTKQRTMTEVKHALTAQMNAKGAETALPIGEVCERFLAYIAGDATLDATTLFDDLKAKYEGVKAKRKNGKKEDMTETPTTAE